MIAQIIERYVSEHPRAADTATGISQWWIEESHGSSADVQQALNYLVEIGRLARVVLADGSVIYSRASSPNRTPDK